MCGAKGIRDSPSCLTDNLNPSLDGVTEHLIAIEVLSRAAGTVLSHGLRRVEHVQQQRRIEALTPHTAPGVYS
jgi:hypothetical protein